MIRKTGQFPRDTTVRTEKIWFSVIVRVWSQLCQYCESVGDIMTSEYEINRLAGVSINKILNKYIPQIETKKQMKTFPK